MILTNYERRKFRVRNKIIKSNKSNRSRVVVYRSNKNFYAQLVDLNGNITHSFSTLKLEENIKASGVEKARMVGENFAKICLATGISEVVFDKGAYIYNGRVKAIAEGCRKAGLKF
jgi:large subunit ribosomal protein L18